MIFFPRRDNLASGGVRTSDMARWKAETTRITNILIKINLLSSEPVVRYIIRRASKHTFLQMLLVLGTKKNHVVENMHKFNGV